MKNFPLYTERLKLRLIEISDLNQIHDLHSYAETDEYNTLGIPANLEETQSIIEPWIEEYQKEEIENFIFAIEKKEDNQFLGLIALILGKSKFKIAEVWYKLNPGCWGNGYATESLNRIIDFAFQDLKLHRIEAGCAINNIASIKVLEKAGMIREGRKSKVLPLFSGWSDNFEYAILETDRGFSIDDILL